MTAVTAKRKSVSAVVSEDEKCRSFPALIKIRLIGPIGLIGFVELMRRIRDCANGVGIND